MSKNKTAKTRSAAEKARSTEVITSIVTVLLFFGILTPEEALALWKEVKKQERAH